MAVVTLQGTKRTLTRGPETREFLKRHGIAFERWEVPAAVAGLQSQAALAKEEQDRVLAAYRSNLDREAKERGYIQADIIVLNPATPNLETMLAKFDKAHYHDDDEVRYIFAGEGVFGFEPAGAPTFTVTVTAGDYIIVPAKTYHWFTLTASRSIKALRLFKDISGWAPHYKNAMG